MLSNWSRTFLGVVCLAVLSACGGSDAPAPPPPSPAVGLAIANGSSHSCALLADKTVSCWGANGVGQLGNGTTENASIPQAVTGLSNVIAIAASATVVLMSPSAGLEGGRHSCALLNDGTVWCWGENSWHQLGPKAPSSQICDEPCSPIPVAVELNNVVAIATGGAHSCARLKDGTVWCWGSNDMGQLGNGTFSFSSPPVKVNELENVTAIAAGGAHSCAILADGTVWCWGGNSTGQLGPSATSDGCTFLGDMVPCSVNPVPIQSLSNVSAIAAGNDYTCARLSDGTVECWGANSFGQLGRDTSLGTTPASIPAPVTGLSKVAAIATGARHSCAALTDTTVKCWGANDGGQLGNTTPTPRFTPVPVPGLSNVTAVAAGGEIPHAGHSCALLTDKTVWCWGANQSLQLGDGSITKSTTPVPVRSLENVTAVAAFGNFTCSVLTDTTVECWGANSFGQLGRDTSLGTTPASIPAPVTGLSKVAAVATGGTYACARLTDMTVECWGNNDHDQLGPNAPLDPSTGKPFKKSLIPVAVGLSNVAALAAGFDYSCAVLTDSTVKCWGATSATPVDVGLTDVDTITVSDRDCAIFKNGIVSCSASWLFGLISEPVELSGQATALAAGYDHRCARLTDGTVKCWGAFNDTGELGNGMFTNPSPILTPVEVVNLANVVGIAAGGHHTCATLLNGTARCWGDNSYGQLGDRTTDRASIPSVVTGLSNVAAIAAGNGHTCARLTDGTVSCWGSNSGGELGDGIIFSTLRPVKVVGIP